MLSPLLVEDNRSGVRDSLLSSTPDHGGGDGGLKLVLDNFAPEISVLSLGLQDLLLITCSIPDTLPDVNVARSSSFSTMPSSLSSFLSPAKDGSVLAGPGILGGGMILGFFVVAS